ncbi:MAG: EAL domain-containing protein [Campylobacteraceae bacterium]|nr:EAL domain-containing protein [Campylobacteraceae bacterium]
MRQLNLTKRLFWIIAFLVIFSNILVTTYLYHQSQILKDYFLSMRYVYHKQFLESKIDLNDSTVGFLPAHASARISQEFEKRSSQQITMRNVTDRPRNPINKADDLETKMIDYFNQNPDKNEKMQLIQENGQNVYFYAAPLRIESYCLQCHGKQEEVLPYIASRYDTAYDYKLGDVRGITSIKIPEKLLSSPIMTIFWQEVIFGWLVVVLLLIFMYVAIKQLTKHDVEQKKELEKMVTARTESLAQKSFELEKANAQQKHLYSVLRTVADSNQILITTQTLEELLKETALCLFANNSFASVKIALVEKGSLIVRESQGFDEAREINFMEQYAFDNDSFLKITKFAHNIPQDYKEFSLKHGITEAYATALRSDKFAIAPLGTLSICTTLVNGFSPEEREMIEELAGDIGFAVNSFLQKENIIKLSYYDSLTNLPNRAMLSEQLRLSMNASRKSKSYGALLFMDLDNFKSINDIKGHASGDKLLVLMAQRLEKIARQNDVVSRFGGDEFAVLLPNIGLDIKEAAQYAEDMAMQILVATKEPFLIENHPFYLTCSIGVVLFSHNDLAESLIAHADSAMYAAKASGRNAIRFFDENVQKIMEEKSSMLQELRDAIDFKQFTLYYQIQVDEEGNTKGVEALIRWIHGKRGLVSPGDFIPLCEESGLILPLGTWVLNEAVLQISRWSTDIQKSHWRISINVSAKQFEQENFVDLVTNAIEKAHIKPSLLRLELTESLLIGDARKALQKIEKLKSMGISLSVDDFGTGYSSLQYLKQLSVDELKIDQSFIRDFLTQKSDALIVETIISIGKTMNMEVIAEGVETQEQFAKLKLMGCENFQGYFFGKPLPPQKL